MTTFLRSVAITSAFAATLLTGCRVGPKYQKPPAMAQAPPASYKESPTQFPNSDGWKVAQPQDAMLHGKWWEIYGDPELNSLEEKLNIDNQTIKVSFENFVQARALVAQARSQLFPTVGVGFSYLHAGTSANTSSSSGTSTTTSGNKQDRSAFSSRLMSRGEPDLWGRVRNTISQAQYSAQVSAADLESQRLTEQASLAIYLFEIRGQDALQAVFDQTIADDKQSLEYTRAQYETGVGPEIAMVEAENALQNAQAAATSLGLARAQFEHAIAVLVGRDPTSFSIPVKPLNATPPPIPVGVPSLLLERRPDIAASERTMASANAAIGVADAAFYPTLTLGAQAGFASSTLQRLVDWSSRVWSVGPSVSQTLYDGGLRRATVNQSIAKYNADVASYRQTVLTAFQQVEDYLASVRILSNQMQQQQAATQSASRFV